MIVVRKLQSEEDVFGLKLWAAYKGEEVFEIIERVDGYLDAMGMKGYFSNYEEWSPAEQESMRFARGRVLDVGCGAGRHSIYLQKSGLDVLGIDISTLAVKISRLRGLRKAKIMSIDDINFEPESFDTIIMMGNNFGLLASLKKAKRLLRRFHRITSKDSLIIAATRDPYKTKNADHLRYHKINKEKGRMGGQVRLRIRHGRCVGKWFDYLLVSKAEMKQILLDTGWKVKEFLDSGESDYIAVIEKSPAEPVDQ